MSKVIEVIKPKRIWSPLKILRRALKPKAYAYIETHSEPSSGKLETYYVLHYPLISSFRKGISCSSTTDPKKFTKIMYEEHEREVNIIGNRLPKGVKSLDRQVLGEKVEVDIARRPILAYAWRSSHRGQLCLLI